MPRHSPSNTTGGLDLRFDDDRPKYAGPPPQCVTCSKFVKVETARRIYEMGDYGTILSVEFQCAKCNEERR